MTDFDPVRTFPEFYSNETVLRLGRQRRWTVADFELVPIHIRELLRTGRVEAAYSVDGDCLMTLTELTLRLPNAANATFYLRGGIDGVAAVLVEKSCPKPYARQLLRLPHLYAEHSMDSEGFLLLVSLPELAQDLSSIPGSKVLHESNGYYEILLEGWVTLSRDMLREKPSPPRRRSSSSITNWGDIYRHLARREMHSVPEPGARLDEPILAHVVELVTRAPLNRDLASVGGNIAVFEHAVLGELFARIQPILEAFRKADPAAHFTQDVETETLYTAAARVLPHRHDTDDLEAPEPLLFNAARSAIEQQTVLNAAPKRKSR